MVKHQLVIDKIREIYQKLEGKIYLHEPLFIGNEKKYLEECIDSTYVSSVGKFVDRFEEMVAEYTGANSAVVCVNGTNALHLAMLLLDVKHDDEVITQPLTFIATCNAIRYIGAHPVFVDVDLDTLGMSPKSLFEFLNTQTTQKINNSTNKYECINKSTGRRIKACVPMHTFGHPCRIDKIVEICKEYNIELIEDAAESLGSFYNEKHTGTFAKIGVLSFNGNKTITTGGGGMLLFNDVNLAQRAKHLSTQAKIAHPWNFEHDEVGFNYRMPNLNAALGCAQMEQLPYFLKSKRELAKKYGEFISASQKLNISFFNEPQHAKSNYWLNVIILKNKIERDEFLRYTNENGVMTRPVWQLMNKLLMFKNCQCGELTNSEWIGDRAVNIPSSVINKNK